MDPDDRRASLVEEFLRHHSIKEWLEGEILRCLPTPHLIDPHLKKTLLLRRLSFEVANRVFCDDTLQCMELLDELDRSLGAAATPATLCAAYCAVAIETTAAPLRKAPRGSDAAVTGFLEAEDRVWNRRVTRLEQSEGRGIVGHELRSWRRVMEEATRNAASRDWLRRRNTMGEAENTVREYLRVAIMEMSEPLMDILARAASGEGDDAAGGEQRLAAAEPSGVPSEGRAPAEELAQTGGLASAAAPEGGGQRPERETDERNQLGGQTDNVVDTDPVAEQLTDLLSSAEVNEVEAALKSSSCEELPRVVVDPLSEEALGGVVGVRISMVEQPAGPNDACENQHHTGVCLLGSSPPRDVEGAAVERNVDEEDHGGTPHPKPPHHGLMQTPAQGSEGSSEFPSSKLADSLKGTRSSTRNRKVLSFKTEFPKHLGRRKIKRWTPQEMDALREAVEKHGKGNWKSILHSYPETFKDRTEVDLKDKWRNMTR